MKCSPNFDTPAPTQTTTIKIFSAMIMSTNEKAAKMISAGEVLLTAGGEEDDLVPQSHDHQQCDRCDQQRRIDQPRRVVWHCRR